jgi:RNA polymerase sigma factor (sigma-70 family)
MMTTKLMPVAANNDAELVAGTLAGNRDAFSQIVSRYQSLVCSLTYSATGNLGQSEDLAQETFITAWKHLVHLRERDKLRAWLCGIARNRINNFLRREGREPSHRAESLEEISASHSPEPLPVEHTISNEEQAILWRSLERLPEIYREPLVLFYREHQSIEAVADQLELTEDAVKQRLSRGRKLLHEQVLAFVEGALERTNPGKVFTLGVLAALPAVATSAKAATVGAALAKSGAAAKGVMTIGSLGGLFAMLGGAYVTWRAHADDAKSPRERQFVLQMIGVRIVAVSLIFAVSYGILKFDFSHQPLSREMLRAAYVFSIYVLAMMLFAYSSRRREKIQIEEETFMEAEWTTPRRDTDSKANPSNTQLNTNFKALKFKAFMLVLAAYMIFQEPWKQDLVQALLWSAILVLCLFWGCHIWKNLPRFQSLRSGWVFASPIIMGLATLFSFNFHQYQAQAGSDASTIALPAEVFTFNLVVVLAYAAFIGILVWKRKAAFRSMPLKQN